MTNMQRRGHSWWCERESDSSGHPTLHLCSSPSMWNRCAVHMPRRIPTADPGREARAAFQIIGKICAMRCLLIDPEISEARAEIGKEKISFWDRVTEQGRGGFLFVVAGKVGNSASMIQMTHFFIRLHGAVSHRCLQKTFPPIRA